MAWNPSPEVQVARDAAKAIERIVVKQRGAEKIDMCVVMWVDDQHGCGYASYGRSSVLCGMARRVADAAYKSVTDADLFGSICMAVTRGNARATDGKSIDFDGIEAEVVGKLRLLRAAVGAEMPEDARRAVVRDLVLPAAELLARFCACVNVEEGAE